MNNGQTPAAPPPIPPPASAVPPPKKSGARRASLIVAGIGCLLLILGAAGVGVAGYLALLNADRANRDSAADDVEKSVEEMVEELRIPDAEKRKVLEPVRDLAAKMRKGEVSAFRGLQRETVILSSPVPAMILAMSFESLYIEPSGLTQEEKAGARVTVARFASGLISSRIPNEQVIQFGIAEARFASGDHSTIPSDKMRTKHILDMTWPYMRERGGRHFKTAMADAEIRQCLEMMRDAADAAGIDERAEASNLADATRKAIEKGMCEEAEKDRSSK